MKKWNGRVAATKRRGTVTYGALANGASATGSVTFASAFGSAPDVMAMPTSSRVTFAVTSVTTTGFNWSASNWSGASVHPDQTTARWVASVD